MARINVPSPYDTGRFGKFYHCSLEDSDGLNSTGMHPLPVENINNMIEIVLVTAVVVFCLVLARLKRPGRLPLPPGPKAWPIVGNALDMPAEQPWEKYREWCETYKSDLVYLHLPMQHTMIVGSVETALELFEKRSQLYSDRISYVVVEELTWDFNIAVMPYTAKWRAHRRMFHQHFYQGTVDKYRPVQLQHTTALLSRILKSPQDTRKHLREMITSVIVSIVYGKKISGMDDEYVISAQMAMEGFSLAMVPGAYWVQYLPFLRHLPSWVPWLSFRKLVDEYLPHVINMRDKPYIDIKTASDKGCAPSSLASTLVDQIRSNYGGTEDETAYHEIAKNVTGIAYGAAADTSTSAAESFMLAMAMFPEVQKKAQSELDRVVGPDRLPEFDDIQNLPYIRAVVMETMRWMPVTPFGVPHAVVADDSYQGYHIPKGTMLIPNVWAMLKNPEEYPNPDIFNPDRFIGQNGDINPDIRDPSTMAFGFGRRLCPGRHFSHNTLFIVISSLLHCFNITAGADPSGKAVELSAELVGGLIAMPRAVPRGFEVRSETAARLILEAATALEASGI